MSEFNPLVQRVDALLKRHQQQPAPVRPADPDKTLDLRAVESEPQLATPLLEEPFVEAASPEPVPPEPPLPVVEDDFPVLTEIVERSALPSVDERNAALAARVEAAVLERVLPGLDLALDQRLGRTVSDLVEQAQTRDARLPWEKVVRREAGAVWILAAPARCACSPARWRTKLPGCYHLHWEGWP